MGLKGTGNTKKIPFSHGFSYYLAISAKVLREDRETTLLITNIFSLQRGLQDRRKKKSKTKKILKIMRVKTNRESKNQKTKMGISWWFSGPLFHRRGHGFNPCLVN